MSLHFPITNDHTEVQKIDTHIFINSDPPSGSGGDRNASSGRCNRRLCDLEEPDASNAAHRPHVPEHRRRRLHGGESAVQTSHVVVQEPYLWKMVAR